MKNIVKVGTTMNSLEDLANGSKKLFDFLEYCRDNGVEISKCSTGRFYSNSRYSWERDSMELTEYGYTNGYVVINMSSMNYSKDIRRELSAYLRAHREGIVRYNPFTKALRIVVRDNDGFVRLLFKFTLMQRQGLIGIRSRVLAA